MAYAIPDALEIDGELYDLLEQRGQRTWQMRRIPTQPGDPSVSKSQQLELSGGFGATHRYQSSRGPTNPTHHDYAQNMSTRYDGSLTPASVITYLSLDTLTAASTGFQFGGSAAGQLGGGANGLGGGSFEEVPQAINEFREKLYVHAGTRTYTIDPSPSTPTHNSTHTHLDASARARSGAVFDNRLLVALGDNTEAESFDGETWAGISGVKRTVYRVGKAGRLFSSKLNRVYNVLAGQDPTVSVNYLPPAGEAVSDETTPVRALVEYARALIAGTQNTIRTFDPDAGFQSRSLLPEHRLSASDYDGRALITIGDLLLYATTRAVWMIRGGQRPVHVGPEILEQNESPYVGGQPGVPDFGGDFIWWPWYFPTTGDSIIFVVRVREPGEAGTGPLAWHDEIYLSARECRTVYFWGGTTTVKPRLFFGAGTSANPEQIGWIGLGRGGTPDFNDADTAPAISAVIYTPAEPFDTPTTIKTVERMEFSDVRGVDSSNYLEVAASTDLGTTYTNLVVDNDGELLDSRITSTGFQTAYAPIHNEIAARKLKFRFTITQAAAASSYVRSASPPVLVYTERPATVDEVTTILRVRSVPSETSEDIENRVAELLSKGPVEIRHQPGDAVVWGKFTRVEAQELGEVPGGVGESDYGIRVTWREVVTSG